MAASLLALANSTFYKKMYRLILDMLGAGHY